MFDVDGGENETQDAGDVVYGDIGTTLVLRHHWFWKIRGYEPTFFVPLVRFEVWFVASLSILAVTLT